MLDEPMAQAAEAPTQAAADDEAQALGRLILAKLVYSVGKDRLTATRHDWFFATALAVRDRIVDGWMASTRATYASGRKRVYYLSLEFLVGRLLADGLTNLGLAATAEGRTAGDCVKTLDPRPDDAHASLQPLQEPRHAYADPRPRPCFAAGRPGRGAHRAGLSAA